MKKEVKNKGDLFRIYRCFKKTIEKNYGEKIIKATFKKIFTSERIHEHSNQKYIIKENHNV